ncbi:MAG TPA: sn-glycerol-3-phosphate ABC transporter ATP-binding protein UgpC [Usitatibacteraceae bacterium]|nr:sn-glycerol-3-phosphate ABC transporter ATP-binding protein UgpC [Usitatibacteraceae bacterium]
MNGVQFEKVIKVYDSGVRVIHGVDLVIGKGEFVVFVGPSGCGKSTLMRMVAGLETISGGTISIDGRVVNDLPPRERDVAMVFQDYALYPHKNVFENLAFGLRLRKFSEEQIKKRVGDAAAILKIEHLLDRKPRALSGGQRQRVAMGRAIVRAPKLFLFDEPLSNLDALLRSEMRVEIKKLHQRIGATTIYVTHDQVEAMTLAQRIVVLSGGHIMQVGTPDEIYNHPRSKFVAGFTGSPPMNFLKGSIEAGDAPAIRLGEQPAIALPPVWRERLAGHAGRAVDFGIRPEDVSAAAQGNAGHALQAQVIVVEPLGAETLVTFATAGGELIARLSPEARFAPGDTAGIHIDLNKFHLFDADSGMAL